MDTSEMRVPLQGAAKLFEAGLKSKTWDIHGMLHFITTTHCEGCDMCEAYALHVVEASKALTVEISPREVEKAFQNAWPNIVFHIEDEASSESDKKVEWYSCQGTTCFPLQKHLRVFPTPTSDTFGILQTPTASEFRRHFGVLLIPSPFQQSPTLLHAPSTPTPRLTPPPKIAPRPPPPLKVAWRPLRTPYPPIWTPLQHSLETLQVVAEIRQLPRHPILRVMSLK